MAEKGGDPNPIASAFKRLTQRNSRGSSGGGVPSPGFFNRRPKQTAVPGTVKQVVRGATYPPRYAPPPGAGGVPTPDRITGAGHEEAEASDRVLPQPGKGGESKAGGTEAAATVPSSTLSGGAAAPGGGGGGVLGAATAAAAAAAATAAAGGGGAGGGAGDSGGGKIDEDLKAASGATAGDAAEAAGSAGGAGGDDSGAAGAAGGATTNSQAAILASKRQADKEAKFGELLAAPQLDMDKLRQLAWGGIPETYRSEAWQLMLAYLPLNRDRRETTLRRKRKEYHDFRPRYFDIPDTDRTPEEQKVLHQILVDLPRTQPDIPLFFDPTVQRCMERALYIWAIRHPASGYVQGINDLLTAFFVVFIRRHAESPYTCDVQSLPPGVLDDVEADSFWCLTKLLDGIQDHYTSNQPGIQRMVHKLQDLVHRMDADLHDHILVCFSFEQFAFRWMNNLLMRELTLASTIRLWDT